MTDRELLEAAARTAGIKLAFDPMEGKPRDCTWAHPAMNLFAMPVWNPLTDDGDALRLMLACKLTNMGRYRDDGTPDFEATRRAIVRAAAAMKEKR